MWPRAFLCQIRGLAIHDFTNAALTDASLQSSTLPKEAVVDVIFLLAVIALYAVTHWLIWAVDRLRSPQ
jgi:hypothetical protein